jgi:large subunit ribosomal protein L3
MKCLIAKKDRMTQIFDGEGRAVPVTVLKVVPPVVAQVKTKEKDGYESVVLAVPTKKVSRVNKALAGKTKALDVVCDTFREFDAKGEALEVGQKIEVTAFEVGDKVRVTGISKGKGFQGVVKRHRFKGGQRTHGQKHSEREAGSIGGGGRAGGRVAKGTRMAGRMGGDTITVRNLTVAAVDAESSLLYVTGAIPGRNGTLIEVRG